MAVLAEIETSFGELRECYIRLNNVEASNHGVNASALFRGFISQGAFEEGKSFVFEKAIEFDADVTLPLWEQAYNALKSLPEFTDAEDC